MRKHRIFIENLPTRKIGYELEPQTTHYAKQMLRLRSGDPLLLFDGRGSEWQTRLVTCEQTRVRVQLTKKMAVIPEPLLSITLIQGISRGDRMDFALQKATELGVARIQPVFCQRSEVKLKRSRMQKRHSHWQSLVISACQQCIRATPPVESPQLLPEYLARGHDLTSTRLILLPDAEASFRQIPVLTADLILCIGPEGGLTEAETQSLFDHGFKAVRLGPRVLRTETTGPAAIAAALLL